MAAFSAGVVTSTALGSFTTSSGETLPELVVAWRHDGLPPPAPQVLVVHALTGSANAAGDWWEPLIGPGKALDTEKVGVLCSNLLGGRYGTTGAETIDPRTGRPWGPDFPVLDTRDQARAISRLADAVGIARWKAVIGGSLGGMVALEVALDRPGTVEHLVAIAAPGATGPMAIAWNHIQIRLLDLLGDEGLRLARQLAMTTYRSERDFAERFGRRSAEDGRFEVVSYLEHQGFKLLERFGPDVYRTLAHAMDLHDIGRDRGGVGPALALLAPGRTRLLAVGIEGDVLYGPQQVRELAHESRAAGLVTTYREIRSTKGHDAFLVEWDQMTAILREELGGRSADASAVR